MKPPASEAVALDLRDLLARNSSRRAKVPSAGDTLALAFSRVWISAATWQFGGDNLHDLVIAASSTCFTRESSWSEAAKRPSARRAGSVVNAAREHAIA